MFLADGSPEVRNEAWRASHNISFLYTSVTAILTFLRPVIFVAYARQLSF